MSTKRTSVLLLALTMLIIITPSIFCEVVHTNLIVLSKGRLEWHFVSSIEEKLKPMYYSLYINLKEQRSEYNFTIPAKLGTLQNNTMSLKFFYSIDKETNETVMYIELQSLLRNSTGYTLVIELLRTKIVIDNVNLIIPWYNYEVLLRGVDVSNISEMQRDISDYLNASLKLLGLEFVKSIHGEISIRKAGSSDLRYSVDLHGIEMSFHEYLDKLFGGSNLCRLPEVDELKGEFTLNMVFKPSLLSTEISIKSRSVVQQVYSVQMALCSIPTIEMFYRLIILSNTSILDRSTVEIFIDSFPKLVQSFVNPSIRACTIIIPKFIEILKTTQFVLRFVLHSAKDYVALDTILVAPDIDTIDYNSILNTLLNTMKNLSMLQGTGIEIANFTNAKIVIESSNITGLEKPLFSHAIPRETKGLEIVLIVVVVLVCIQTAVILYFIVKTLKKH